jgi:hypothetical protein
MGLDHAGAASRVAGALLLADALLIAVYLATHLPGYEVDTLSLSHERSIPNWYSSAKLLLLAQLLGFLAWRTPATPRAHLVLLAPATFFLLLSLDEVDTIHERLEPRTAGWVGGGEGDAGYWPLLAGSLLASAMAVMGVAYARLVRPPAAAIGKAVLGAVALVGGAAATDFANNVLQDGRGLVLGTALEEGLELVGVTFFIWAVLDMVEADGRPTDAEAARKAEVHQRP